MAIIKWPHEGGLALGALFDREYGRRFGIFSGIQVAGSESSAFGAGIVRVPISCRESGVGPMADAIGAPICGCGDWAHRAPCPPRDPHAWIWTTEERCIKLGFRKIRKGKRMAFGIDLENAMGAEIRAFENYLNECLNVKRFAAK